MVERVADSIYRIGVVLPNNPLRELNSYLIRSEARELLVDTGFRCEECRTALEDGLRELGSRAERRDVLVTHIHSDHSGMADLFAGPGRHIYMSQIDLDIQRKICDDPDPWRLERYVAEGFPRERAERTQRTNPARVMALPQVTENFRGLRDGDVIRVGGYALRAIHTPGHTPGHMMFWEERYGIMFSGDHVLFDISPNITTWGQMEDSLGDYLGSLKRVKDYPVRKTLPGHRKTGDYHQRIEELETHHRTRLEEILRIVAQRPGMTAYEITSAMSWRIQARNWDDFPDVQKWFAVGEAIAHLDYLQQCGKLQKTLVNGVWQYCVI